MRLLLDSSVLLGYLASANPERTAVAELLRMIVDGRVDLLWTGALRIEVQRTAALRPSIRKRVNDAAMADLLGLVERFAVPVPPMADPVPRVCRDPGDDFVVATAVAGRVDLVVTLDNDLLVLGEHAGVRFVKPGAALAAIREAGERTGGR